MAERVGAAEPSELDALKGVRALVVDDNPTHRRVVQEILSPAGVQLDEVAAARSGLDAMRQAHAAGEAYELAIIDAYMDRGGNFIDTANVYSAGVSEKIVGEGIRKVRERLGHASGDLTQGVLG